MFEFLQTVQHGVPELPAAALLFLFFFGTFVSEDVACLAAGVASANGSIGFVAALTACFLGIFAGDLLLYAAGRALGDKIFENRVVRRFVSDKAKTKASVWLNKNGASAVFLSRFVTGLRLPTYLAAGALRTDFRKFATYFLLASAIWTPILVGAATFSQLTFFRQLVFAGLIIIGLVIRLVLKYSSRKNRRLFIGRLKRIVNWEFWPIHIFYSPVVLYVICLALKHRSLTAFSAVNPAMPASGFKGESKNDIYESLKRSDAAKPFLLQHKLLRVAEPVAERVLQAGRLIDDHRLRFPLALKPDAGERGKDVRFVGSHSELESEIATAKIDLILQEGISGEEVSVFYHRYPGNSRGRIFSITEKRFPTVIGDGRSTLEKLILNDRRTVCLAEKYWEQNRERLDQIPDAGEEVRLTDIGTHSRGAIFLDGGWLKTDALELKIDDICRGVDGFYFGRFDIRAPSFSDLQQGENFKIIELNGVTSESTNIYDPRYSLSDAYRILFRQWRIAFEIGAENIRLGARKTSILDLAKLTFGMDLPKESPTLGVNLPLTTDQCA
jgi:membrane protein DedA with SNARE-associated domain